MKKIVKTGKWSCTCQTRVRTSFGDNGEKLENGIDMSSYYDVEFIEGETQAPACPYECGNQMVFKEYDISSISIAKYSAQSTSAKRESLVKRRDDFNKSKEGKYMRQRANFHQLGHEAG